ncbi:uncharacterized protein LOC124929448 [Impatiens glandulifera]|uniref:uncharacterized protein LOC124929448 n=1 Tax=Impatiens glandulifera TaxID=253017 RepID=UPI001FB0B437|nr:uncharacterized protein LOC124929448 [Impatiens glandulifera]
MRYNEINHFSHPQHKLKFDYSEVPFKCDGCKEIGIGSHYKCASISCNFDLHTHCAIPSPSIFHPFYTKCSFQFLSRPPGNAARYCNACERDVTGFLYHCGSCDFDLHPCCAKLPMMLDDGEVKLYLYRKVSSPCHRCGRKGRSWSYRSACKRYNLHVACVKEMLVESWHDLYFGGGYSISNEHDYNNNNVYIHVNGDNDNKNDYHISGRKLETRIPSLKRTLQTYNNHHRYTNKGKGKAKVNKCCEMATLAVQFIVSAILGDPTALIAGVVGTLISLS